MAGRLSGKTAFITAAAQGIGRAIAEAFVAEGAKVIATDIDEKKLAGLKARRCAGSTCARPRRSNAIAKEFGPVDILVNCAGFVHHGTVLSTCSDEEWDCSFDLNVKSMHRTIRAFLPGMLEKGGGSIVNIASGASSVRGIPNRYVYGATKAAVIGLTKAVAADFIKQGIRANAICPGTIESPSLDERIDTQAQGRADSRSTTCGRPSSTASRWAGSARPRRSPGSRSIWPPTSRATRPGRSTWPTAGLRCSAHARGFAASS